MTVLLSNYPPVKLDTPMFNDTFGDLLSKSTSLDIAVGYISEAALDYLSGQIQNRGAPNCNLIIGMHYFEHFTYSQFAAAKEMEGFLRANQLGTVKLVTSFPFHGKLYSFELEDGSSKTIVGSSNLTNIVPIKPLRQYELDILINDEQTNKQLSDFIGRLDRVSLELSDENLVIDSFKVTNDILTGLPGVTLLESTLDLNLFKQKLDVERTIKLPITPYEKAQKSNVNAYFGKGRENRRTGIIRQRPWYEVELIVPKAITDKSWYPKAGYPNTESVITVITDDGYKFQCKISGTNSKNFRSVRDLRVLGKWIKGRLENSGVLKVGEAVTNDVLTRYGRNNIEFVPSSDPSLWYLDFSI